VIGERKQRENAKGVNELTDRIFYRGDKGIYQKAKAAAALAGKPVGKYIDEALEEKVKKETK